MSNTSSILLSCRVCDGKWYTGAGMDSIEAHINILLDKVRPYVQTHGGDVQLLRVEEGTAYLKTYGSCVDCTLASVTYTKTVGPLIVKEVEGVTEVVFE